MRSYVQVLTTPTADTPGTTLLLHFDNKRYLIGSLAEGTQRACVQVGARMLKVSECFITGRTEWANVGGLLGMILTLADAMTSSHDSALNEALTKTRRKAIAMGWGDDRDKLKEVEDEVRAEHKRSSTLTLFGAPNLNHLLATARRFIFRKGMPVNVHEVDGERPNIENGEEEDEWAPYWADQNIKVWAMSILPSTMPDSSSKECRPISPRKRSIDEVNGLESSTIDTSNADLTSKERDLLTVKAVVSEMFDSSWRLDTLHETPLSQVRTPATIFIRSPETNKVVKYSGPLPGGEQPLPDPDLKVLVRRPWPGALVESLPHTEPSKAAVSYIIRNHTQRGKFNRKKALELGVKEGPDFSKLAAGESVQNTKGETINPDQVLGESKEGGGIAVIDIPDPSYLDNLLARPEWQEPKVMAGVGAMVWICGKDVVQDARAQQFMKEHANLQHIVSSAECCPNYIAMDSSAAATVRMRKIDPVRYRVPVHEEKPAVALASSNGTEAGVSMMARGQVVQLEPTFAIQDKQVLPPISIADVEKEIPQDILDEAAKAHQSIESDLKAEAQWAADIPDKEAEIITLGTGSALPSKYRNVSATLLRVPGWGSMLFDCGENTLGQLKRVFEPGELKQVLQSLRIIVISHMHADHHLGTVGVIRAWYREVHNSVPASADSIIQGMMADNKRLAIISEPAMAQWLTEYASVEDYGFSRVAPIVISPHDRIKRRPSRLSWFVSPTDLATLSPEDASAKLARSTIIPSAPYLKLRDIQAVAVRHCHGARAMTLTFPSGLKISYSGDCRPSRDFGHIGRGSHVCIHEATFDDELQTDAEAKNHSTTSEALGVAQMMGAKACLLTHFSQRYQKLPVLEHSANCSATASENGDPSSVVADAVPAPNDADADVDGDGDDYANDPEMATGPLDDGNGTAAATFPDQIPANGAVGKQYDLSASSSSLKRNASTANGNANTGPAAVRLKVASDMRVGVAFDYMRVKIGEIGQLEKFTPALLKLFAEEDKSEKAVVPDAAAEKGGEGGKKGKKEKKKGLKA